MHFHLPKPMHGWREFAGEIAIIVIGVLIALGAEQLVEDWNWRHRANDAAETLKSEVANHYAQSSEAAVVAPCVDRQLQILSERLTQTPLRPAPLFRDSDGSGMGGEYVLRVPSRSWSDNEWRGVSSEGVVAHLKSQLRDRLGLHYAIVTIMREENRETDKLSYRFNVLAHPAAIDPATRGRLAEEIEEARGLFQGMGDAAKQIMPFVRSMGVAPTQKEVQGFLNQSGTVKFCRAHGLPLGKIG